MSYSDEFNAKAAHNHLMLSQAGDAELAGLQSLNNVNPDDDHKSRKKKREEKHYYDFLQLLTETQIKLQDFIDDIDLKLIQARQDLEQHKEMLAERITLEHCIDVLDNDGLLERNADGSLKDKDLERAVTRYLKDNNMSMDLSDDARIYAIAQKLITTYPTQEQLKKVIDLDNQIIDTLQHGKDQAQTLQDKLNDPNISKREVEQIASDTDELITEFNQNHSSLISQRDAVFSSTSQKTDTPQPARPQENSVLDFDVGLDKDLTTTELPQSNLNF